MSPLNPNARIDQQHGFFMLAANERLQGSHRSVRGAKEGQMAKIALGALLFVSGLGAAKAAAAADVSGPAHRFSSLLYDSRLINAGVFGMAAIVVAWAARAFWAGKLQPNKAHIEIPAKQEMLMPTPKVASMAGPLELLVAEEKNEQKAEVNEAAQTLAVKSIDVEIKDLLLALLARSPADEAYCLYIQKNSKLWKFHEAIVKRLHAVDRLISMGKWTKARKEVKPHKLLAMTQQIRLEINHLLKTKGLMENEARLKKHATQVEELLKEFETKLKAEPALPAEGKDTKAQSPISRFVEPPQWRRSKPLLLK